MPAPTVTVPPPTPRWVIGDDGLRSMTHTMDDNVRPLRPGPEELIDDRYLLDTFLEYTPDSVYFKDEKSRFVRLSRALAERLGLDDPADAIGRTDFDFFSEEHARTAFADEQRLMQTGEPLVGIEERETWEDGRDAWVSTTKVPLRNRAGQIIGLFGLSRDITERKRDEQRLEEQAAQLAKQAQALEQLTLVDELTDLHNRRGLQAFGEQALYRARRDGTTVTLLFLDLDGLKQLNDACGHRAGDEALRAVAAVIKGTVRESDIAARIGGDEFAILLTDRDGEVAERVAERLVLDVAAARQVYGLPFDLSVTVGAAEIDARTPGSLEELLAKADRAMYDEKLGASAVQILPLGRVADGELHRGA